VDALPATEIKALAKIIGELDYYQLLHLAPDASVSEVKYAFHTTSRNFHPDAVRHLEPDLHEAVEHIAKRVREAYSVLRDSRRRRAYDQNLAEGGGPRMQLAQATSQAERQATEELQGRTPQGRQYFHMATSALDSGDAQGAVRNLQTALTFEPDNEHFRDLLAKARAQA